MSAIATVSGTEGAVAHDVGSALKQLGGLSAEDFFTLLMAQLRNQNPLEPLQDKDLMAQFAQLNSLEELKQIGQNMEALLQTTLSAHASALIGKWVVGTTDDGTQVQGLVNGYEIRGGVYYLQIGQSWLPMRDITSVYEGGDYGATHQATL